jgi:FMN phosphatase YigB (HAD superfamily)
MAGAAELLREVALPVALCSNAQAYTLMELRLALRAVGIRNLPFDLHSSFFSYQHRIAKPHPAIWQRLTAKAGNVPSAAMLMVGDRLDNDVQPARLAGWSTWLLNGR